MGAACEFAILGAAQVIRLDAAQPLSYPARKPRRDVPEVPLRPPQFFQIGLNGCGARVFATFFHRNGYRAEHSRDGELAADILTSQRDGRAPLTKFARVTAFTGLESLDDGAGAPAEATCAFAFLDRSFPKAVFLLNHMDLDTWAETRAKDRNGATLAAYARAWNLTADAVKARWRDEAAAHLEAVRRHFSGRPDKLIEFHMDEDRGEELAARLAPHYLLDPARFGPQHADRRAAQLVRIDPARKGQIIQRHMAQFDAPRAEFLRRQVAHQVKGVIGRRLDVTLATLASNRHRRSRLFGAWSATAGEFLAINHWRELLGPTDGGLGIAASADEVTDDPAMRAQLVPHKCLRTAVLINQIAPRAERGVYAFDMQDGRDGLKGVRTDGALTPCFQFNRMAGAVGAILWPLAGYMDIGAAGFLGAPTPDEPDFYAKAPMACWRGALSGGAVIDGQKRRVGEALSGRWSPAGAPIPLDSIIASNPRLRFLQAAKSDPRVDAGLTPGREAEGWEDLLAAYLVEPLSMAEQRQNRYLLALEGHDYASSLYWMLASKSVVLKQDYPWETFADAHFEPWTHFVPLAADASDLPEKLDWCEANLDECAAISGRARSQCAMLADPDLRDACLDAVVAIYESAFERSD